MKFATLYFRKAVFSFATGSSGFYLGASYSPKLSNTLGTRKSGTAIKAATLEKPY